MFVKKEKNVSENMSADKKLNKGRPTPKRREAEKQNLRPLVPADRKEAKRQARAKRNAFYEKQRQALLTGDERYLPIRDKGVVKRWVRDWVDARFSWCEFMFPLLIIVLMSSFFFNSYPKIMIGILVALYTILISSIIEAIIATQFLKRSLRKRFKESEIPPRIGYYAFLRMLQFPMMRSPKPLKKHGEWPT